MYKQTHSAPYRCDLTHHFKIWLTQNPHIPLGFKNECRIIDFLLNNPRASLSVIVDKRLYSELGHKRLDRFLTMLKKHFPNEFHRLSIIDFDDIKKACDLPVERQLIEIIENEIRQKYVGWTGLVSDIIRILSSACELGIYSDFDISLFLENHHSIALPSNFLFRHNRIQFIDQVDKKPLHSIYTVSNDMLVFLEPKNNLILRKFQAFVLSNLQNPGNKRTNELNHHSITYFNFSEMRQIYFTGCSVVEYVINTTGPGALEDFLLRNFYSEFFKEFFDETTSSLKPHFIDAFNGTTRQLFSISNHFPKGSFANNQSNRFTLLKDENNKGSDVSWIPNHAIAHCTRFDEEREASMKDLAHSRQKLNDLEEKMKSAAITLSHFWKKRQRQLQTETSLLSDKAIQTTSHGQ